MFFLLFRFSVCLPVLYFSSWIKWIYIILAIWDIELEEISVYSKNMFISRWYFNIWILIVRSNTGSGNNKVQLAFSVGDTRRLGEINTYNGTIFTANLDAGSGCQQQRRSDQVGNIITTTETTFVYYWRVDTFWRLAFVDARMRSPPFYVSSHGYRIALTVHSDVLARTVSVSVVLAAGDYDAQLRWPFVHRLRLSVLDQTVVASEDIVFRVWNDVRCGIDSSTSSQHRYDTVVYVSMELKHDVLTYRRYTAGNTLLVKLMVFI